MKKPTRRSTEALAGVIPFDLEPTPTLDELQMLRPQEVADLLKVSKRKVYTLLQQGTITPTHIGCSVRVSKADLYCYLQEQRGR